jgi:hypothetical protein
MSTMRDRHLRALGASGLVIALAMVGAAPGSAQVPAPQSVTTRSVIPAPAGRAAQPGAVTTTTTTSVAPWRRAPR